MSGDNARRPLLPPPRHRAATAGQRARGPSFLANYEGIATTRSSHIQGQLSASIVTHTRAEAQGINPGKHRRSVR